MVRIFAALAALTLGTALATILESERDDTTLIPQIRGR